MTMMMFTQRKVGLSRLHRTHLPKQRLSSLIWLPSRDVVWPGDAQFSVQHSAGWELRANDQR